MIHLNAGDYKEMAGDRSRPEFLLDYTGWCKHFGLKISEQEQANELPDHIVCQLEFIAWLAHLECNSDDKPELQFGYQCAQRDFCERHLQQFLALMVASMAGEYRKSQREPLFFAVAKLALESVNLIQLHFDNVLGKSVGQVDNPELISSVNLWG